MVIEYGRLIVMQAKHTMSQMSSQDTHVEFSTASSKMPFQKQLEPIVYSPRWLDVSAALRLGHRHFQQLLGGEYSCDVEIQKPSHFQNRARLIKREEFLVHVFLGIFTKECSIYIDSKDHSFFTKKVYTLFNAAYGIASHRNLFAKLFTLISRNLKSVIRTR